MPTITKDLYEEITTDLSNLKTDKDEDHVFVKNDSLFKV